MEALLLYSIWLWFGFWLVNYADITARPAAWLKKAMGPKWGYPLSCAACWAFHISWMLWLIDWVPVWYIFTAPVTHLFIDLGYSRLTESHVTATYQMSFDGSCVKVPDEPPAK